MKYQIDILDEPLRWKWSPKDLDEFLGGSQEGVIQLARALARRGHGVSVFYDGEECDDQGVHYRTRDAYDRQSDIVIGFNHPSCFPSEFIAESAFYWTTCPEIWPGVTYDYGESKIVALSKWHENELKKNIPQAAEKITHIYYGLDPLDFDFKRKRLHNHFLFASSWDRGLNILLQSWPKIKRKIPDAVLHITYGQKFSSKIIGFEPPLPPGIDHPGIVLENQVTKRRMAELYKECEYLLYPCTGGERFCLTTWKAQYGGCIPLYYPKMALEETVRAGFPCDRMPFAEHVIFWATNKQTRPLFESMRKLIHFSTWDEIAVEWEKLFESVKIKQA